MIKRRNGEKGVALVVTLSIVVILVAAALYLSRVAVQSAVQSRIERDRFAAEELAISGTNIAIALLAEDAGKSEIDSIQEVWADEEKLSQAVKDIGLDDTMLEIRITDELSKIQVNAMIQAFPGNEVNPDQIRIWENFLKQFISDDMSEDSLSKDEIINCVKDWLDSRDDDAISGLSGAESEYYQGLDPPYSCANGPLNHISEITSIKGFDKDMFGSDTQEDEGDGAGGDDDEESTAPLGFKDVFTVYGIAEPGKDSSRFSYEGKVNINTAGPEVLAALLPSGMEEWAQDLSDYRSAKNEQGDFINPLDKGWYKKVIDLSQKEAKQFERVIRYNSDTFKIECIAHVKGAVVTQTVYVKRQKHKETGKWKCRIISLERS